jgi:hypothetical protein
VVIAANRDEMQDRPWQAPARHWPDRPNIVGGLDELAGGSWLAMNDHGVVAAILNRHGTLGPQEGKRTRGELVLDALDHADASDAAAMLVQLDGRAYRPFNMLVADNRDAFWICHRGEAADGGRRLQMQPLPAGVSMLTASDVNAVDDDQRIVSFLPRFCALSAPVGDVYSAAAWQEWERLITVDGALSGEDPRIGMCFMTPVGFGTSSSSLLALPSMEGALEGMPVWRFCADPRGDAIFHLVSL